MTQQERLLQMFHEHKNKLTLRDIMQTTLACEYRARITELRKKGFNILCIRGKSPSDNVYELTSLQV